MFDWLRNWCEFSGPITEHSEKNQMYPLTSFQHSNEIASGVRALACTYFLPSLLLPSFFFFNLMHTELTY